MRWGTGQSMGAFVVLSLSTPNRWLIGRDFLGSNVVLCARDTVQHTVKLSSVSKREERLIFFLNDLFFFDWAVLYFFLSFSPSRLLLLLFFLCLVDRVERERERERDIQPSGTSRRSLLLLILLLLRTTEEKKKFSFYFLPLISHLFIFFTPPTFWRREREKRPEGFLGSLFNTNWASESKVQSE